MLSLLQLAVHALGRLLCSGSGPVDLSAIPEAELAAAVFQAWQRCLAASAAAGRPPPLARQHQVLADFATAFWHPQLLRLAYPGAVPRAGLSSLQLVAPRLLHLDLAAPALQQLDVVAAACPQLRCLCLRGCFQLGDASLAALSHLAPTLQALDLGGLEGLTDGAVYQVARHLPKLAALNLSGTAVSDRGLELLVYGHKVRGWQAAAGGPPLPPEAAAWPALPLEHLQLAGTHVGADGAAELAQLPQLRFLDMRHTGIPRAALAPLQRRFALQFIQPAVLSSSNSAAAAVVNQDAVLCRCGCGCAATPSGGTSAALQHWEAQGVQLLLHWDPAAGLAGVLTDGQQQQQQAGPSPPQQQQQQAGWRQPSAHGLPPAHGASAVAAPRWPAAGGMPGGRRTGYRQPAAAAASRKRPLQ